MQDTIIVKRKISELKKAPINIRLHPEKQMNEYKRSVRKNGLLKIPVIDENNIIWCGNGLYDAMVAEGYTETYCILKEGLTEVEKKKMMTSENRIFDLGVDDMSVFEEFLKEFGDDLDIPGYDEDLIKTLLSDPETVDEAMSSYGVVPEERKEEIKRNEGMYDDTPGDPPSESGAPVATPQNVPQAVEHEASKQEYVICPNCGEKIWL